MRDALRVWWKVESRQPLILALKYLGFVIGFLCALLLLAFIHYERSYDRWVGNGDTIVRALEVRDVESNTISAMLPYPFADAARDLAQVVDSARMQPLRAMVQKELLRINWTVYFVEPAFLDLFEVEIPDGRAQPLSQPFSVVLSEHAALTYFSRTDVVGETLMLGGEFPITVSAVMRTFPGNSHLSPDILMPFDSFLRIVEQKSEMSRDRITGWTNCGCYATYLRLDRSASFAAVNDALPQLLSRAQGEEYASERPIFLQRLTDVYLESADVSSYLGHARQGDKFQLALMLGIAVALLFMSAINFAGFSVAQMTLRSREMAMRRILGERPLQIVMRLILETEIICLLAFALAFVLALYLIEPFGVFMRRDLGVATLSSGAVVGQAGLAAVAVGVLSASFAAFRTARTQPAELLRDHDVGATGLLSSARLRKAMLGVQLLISCTLVICASGIYQQIDFVRSAPLGFDHANIVIVNGEGSHDVNSELLLRLAGYPGVEAVTQANLVPTAPMSSFMQATVPGRDLESAPWIAFNQIDFDYFDLLGIDVIAGRALAQEYGADRYLGDSERPVTFNIVVNETATGLLGFGAPADAIGELLVNAGDRQSNTTMRIVGVAEDIRYGGPREPVEGMIYTTRRNWNDNQHRPRYLLLKTGDGSARGLRAGVSDLWNQLVPNVVAEVYPLSQALSDQTRGDRQQFQIVIAFTVLTLVVALIGVLSIAAFTMRSRSKELAIRQVLGARHRQIAALVASPLALAALVSSMLSFPLAYLLLNRWLEGFVVRTDISPVWFLFGVVSVAATVTLVALVFARQLAMAPPSRYLCD